MAESRLPRSSLENAQEVPSPSPTTNGLTRVLTHRVPARHLGRWLVYSRLLQMLPVTLIINDTNIEKEPKNTFTINICMFCF